MRELVGGKNTIGRTTAVLKKPRKATFNLFFSGKVETSVTRTLITHGNDWYQQGTEQLLWRYMLNASIVTGLGEKRNVTARILICEVLVL